MHFDLTVSRTHWSRKAAYSRAKSVALVTFSRERSSDSQVARRLVRKIQGEAFLGENSAGERR